MSSAILGREAKNPIGCLPCVKRRKKVVKVTPAPPALDKKQPAEQVEKATESTVSKSGFKGVYFKGSYKDGKNLKRPYQAKLKGATANNTAYTPHAACYTVVCAADQ